MSTTWLITGAAGFIGSNLCAYLIERGHDVLGVDNFSTGKRENVERVQRSSGGRFRFIEADIRDRAAMQSAARGVANVVHLAAQGSVQKSYVDIHHNNEVNVTGFLNTLSAAADGDAKTFIYASSCAVYGDNASLPIGETECPKPLSPYAASKLANDLYASCLAPRHPGMRLIGLRLFNIFGPWQDPEGDYAAVIPKWINLLLSGKSPVIFGDGSATRDFCYVGNVCALVDSLAQGQRGTSGNVYNIGTGQPTSLKALYQGIISILGRRKPLPALAKAEHRPWRQGDIVHSLADIARARHELGFEPRVGLQDGLEFILKQQYGS